jgi:3-deoxy-D-manno-octulosonate 8-phosphate phosphatase (KDO 8-P phosphatase)
MNTDLINLFEELGGEFISPSSLFEERWNKIKVLVFDWDGVFNTGIKGHETTSHFTEADSMGVNMLRFSYWLKNDHRALKTAIITGQNNVSALHFAEREHFDGIYMAKTNKKDAFKNLLSTFNVKAEEVLFVYDDVLDLPVAEMAGLRIMINRYASPLFYHHVKSNALADYITFNEGGENAVRECCELLIAMNDNYSEVMNKRSAYLGDYESYLKERNLQITSQF